MAILARDVMQTHVVTVDADISLLDAQRLFVEEEISGAPVVDGGGRIVGVVSARDLLRGTAEEQDTVLSEPYYYRDLAEFSGPDWASGPEDFQNRLASRKVSEVMTEGALTLPPDATVGEIARTLRQGRIHRVPIAQHGVLVGIVSTFDLIALLEKEPPSR
jgi:CBS domain-containing protein